MPLDGQLDRRTTDDKPPEEGDKYVAVRSFDDCIAEWGIPYPSLGEVVTLVYAEPHHLDALASMGVVLMHFKEYPHHPTGICNKTVDGFYNFLPVK